MKSATVSEPAGKAEVAMAAVESGASVGDSACALTAWFLDNQRDLPWRKSLPAGRPIDENLREMVGERVGEWVGEPVPNKWAAAKGGGSDEPAPRRDPYATWISEIMLQQTQVATVLDYYRRWMARFPNVVALALADEKDVLEAWAGLGYYSRARNVLDTARKITAEFGGRFPWRREALLSLKGVGEYTAGAIASLAFNRPEPILDGNIVRVFSRLNGWDFLPDDKANRKAYWDLARTWTESQEPALVNEGLMELGALVCTPKSPVCGRCPLSRFCLAFAGNAQDRYPPARSRKEAVDVGGFAVVGFAGSDGSAGSGKGEHVLVYTPRKAERLAGLYTFPVFTVADLPALREAWKSALPELAGAGAGITLIGREVAHSITHHRYRLGIAETRADMSALSAALPEGYTWMPVAGLKQALVSSLPRKIWKALGRAGTSR